MGTAVEVEEVIATTPILARRWNVVLHNDDYHSFEFVIDVLIDLFGKGLDEAVQLTFAIHHEGAAVVATCGKERASLYLEQIATRHEWRGQRDLGPLSASMEPAE